MGRGGEEVLLGVDVGTTNVKAAAYTLEGRPLAVTARRLPALHPRPGWSEYDAEVLFATAATVIRDAVERLGGRQVVSLAVASMAETAVPVDGAGTPLHHAVAWHDERAREQAEWWRREVGSEAVYAVTGLPVIPIFGIHKLMWFRQHDPDAFGLMRAWLNVADYVAYRLCGVQATDLSLASRLMVLDLERRVWSDDLLAACGVDASVMAELVPSGQRLGGVHAAGHAVTGLAVGTPVCAGGHDHPCGAFALGLTEPGDVLDSMGTSESLMTVLDRPVLTPEMGRSGYQQGVHVVGGRTYCNGGLYTSGACVEWLRGLLLEDEGGAEGYATLATWAATSPRGSRGVHFLPHLRYASPPIVDLDARAAFVGVTAATTRADLARAVVEGLAYEAQGSLDGLVERVGVSVGRVRAIGGGTRNELLMRVKGALLDRSLEVARHDEVTTLGAALLAGVGVGAYESAEDASRKIALEFDVVPVDAVDRAAYRAAYRAVHRRLYGDLREIHRAISSLERRTSPAL